MLLMAATSDPLAERRAVYAHEVVTRYGPSDPRVEAAFAKDSTWLASHAPAIEDYLGEFGVYNAADANSTRRWITMVRSAAEQRGWGWAVWDYSDSFGVRKADGSGTAVLEGLFSK